MSISAKKRAASDKQVADDIQEYGCNVISVFDPEELTPCFSYSIGIQETSGVPDAIVVGLKSTLGGFMINEYYRQVRTGNRFKRGVLYESPPVSMFRVEKRDLTIS